MSFDPGFKEEKSFDSEFFDRLPFHPVQSFFGRAFPFSFHGAMTFMKWAPDQGSEE